MKFTELHPVSWEHTHCEHDHTNWNDVEAVIADFNPMLRGKVADFVHSTNLNEATVNELKSLFDDDFLRQKERSQELEGFRKEKFDGDTISFYVPSSKTRVKGATMEGKGYHVKVQFSQWGQLVEDADLNANEAARLAFWASDVKLHCTCPSMLYHGYQYLLTAIDASIYPEDRKPMKANPAERGIVCKHARRVLDYLGGNLTHLSQEIKTQRNMDAGSRRQDLERKQRERDLQNNIKKDDDEPYDI